MQSLEPDESESSGEELGDGDHQHDQSGSENGHDDSDADSHDDDDGDDDGDQLEVIPDVTAQFDPAPLNVHTSESLDSPD